MGKEEICMLMGCSGLNKDCPGNENCEILKKITTHEEAPMDG